MKKALSFKIEGELYKAFKVYCAERDVKIGEAMEILIKEKIGYSEPARRY
jgi:hypothetical protein